MNELKECPECGSDNVLRFSLYIEHVKILTSNNKVLELGEQSKETLEYVCDNCGFTSEHLTKWK